MFQKHSLIKDSNGRKIFFSHIYELANGTLAFILWFPDKISVSFLRPNNTIRSKVFSNESFTNLIKKVPFLSMIKNGMCSVIFPFYLVWLTCWIAYYPIILTHGIALSALRDILILGILIGLFAVRIFTSPTLRTLHASLNFIETIYRTSGINQFISSENSSIREALGLNNIENASVCKYLIYHSDWFHIVGLLYGLLLFGTDGIFYTLLTIFFGASIFPMFMYFLIGVSNKESLIIGNILMWPVILFAQTPKARELTFIAKVYKQYVYD